MSELTIHEAGSVSTPYSSSRVDVELVEQAEIAEENRLAKLAGELRSLAGDASVDLAIRIGQLVIDRLYAGDLSTWRTRGAKAHSLRALARRADLPISTSALYRSIALFELASRMGGVSEWSELGISHMRLVLGLPREEQRRLLDQACASNWTVAELERETTAIRNQNQNQGFDQASGRKRGGRPRLPRFVKSLNHLRKYTEASEDLFGDLDAAASMTAHELAELRATLELVRSRCDQLQQALAEG